MVDILIGFMNRQHMRVEIRCIRAVVILNLRNGNLA